MKKWITWWCVLLFLAGFATASAQQVEGVEDQGFQTVTFDLPKGQKTIYLPANIHSGDKISGVVVSEPAGRNDRQRQRNSSVLNGYVVEVEDGENEPGPGFLKTVIPAVTSGTLVNILLRDRNGRVVDRVAIPVEPPGPQLPMERIPEFGDIDIPDIMQAGQPTLITGPFDGDFATTDLTFNDQPGTILCESPDGLIIQAPDDLSGPVNVDLVEQDVPFTAEIYNVDVNLTASNLRLRPGQQTSLTMALDGLPPEGLPVEVELINLTPGVADLSGGNTQTITINPADLPGTYTQDFIVSGLQAGGFSIQATIIDQRDPVVYLVYPNHDEIVESEEITFSWRSAGFEPDMRWNLRLWQLADDKLEDPVPEQTEQLIFEQKGLEGHHYTLPISIAQNMPDFAPFRWDIEPTWNIPFDLKGDGLFRKAKSRPRCVCERIKVNVRVTNVSTGSTASMSADVPPRSNTHKMPIRQSNPNFAQNWGDQIRIQLTGIEVKCSCEEEECNTEGTRNRDRNRSATVDLGENDPAATNDNYNFVRTRNANNGWNGGTFTINGQLRNQNTTEKAVYQTFVIKAWCSHDDCRNRTLCKRRFAIIF